MSGPRMTVKQYEAYLARRRVQDASSCSSRHQDDKSTVRTNERPVRPFPSVSKWSTEAEKRYLFGVLGGHGDFEAETLTFTPDYLPLKDKHGYTPDYVTVAMSMSALVGTLGKSFVAPSCPIPRKVYHEVKGHYRLQSQDGARLRWCMAALNHPEAIFVWAKETKAGHHWDIEIWFDGGRTCLKERNVLGFSFKENGGVEWRR